MCNIRRTAICFLVAIVFSGKARGQTIDVDTKFEGGSARVIEIDQENSVIRIMPNGNPRRGWPAWWYLRVTGLSAGQSIKLNVVPSSRSIPTGHPGAGKPLAAGWSLPDRATWSADGQSWQHTAAGERGSAGVTYQVTSIGKQIWMAWGPPATPVVFNQWIDDFATRHPYARSFVLTKTNEGRDVRGLFFAAGQKPIESRRIVWLHARQHAWESGSSWVARGIANWITGDSDDASWLRENALIYLVPIMDVDRAATGDGGKESEPHDHNRDWSDQPHYPEVAAVQALVQQWAAQNRLAVFVDLHNPGPRDAAAFFYIAPDEAIDGERKQIRHRFLANVQKHWSASIQLSSKTRSTGPSYHKLWRQISGTWATEHGGKNVVALCLETPWNTKQSTTVGYAEVGASLGMGITRFLRDQD